MSYTVQSAGGPGGFVTSAVSVAEIGAIHRHIAEAMKPAAVLAIRLAVAEQMQKIPADLLQENEWAALDWEALRVLVDGVPAGSLDFIKPDSRVVLDYAFTNAAVKAAIRYIISHGPLRSGNWRDSVVVVADGFPVPTGARLAPGTREAMVVVTAPYARRLEIGNARDGSPFAVQVQQHFLERAVLSLRASHGVWAQYSFEYVDLDSQMQRPSRGWFGARRRTRADGVIRYPAIIVRDNAA